MNATKKSAKMKKMNVVGMVVCAAWMLGANAAFAGEITGNGKWIAGSEEAPLNGKSACAYSGREDDPTDPMFKGTMAQAWGLIAKVVRDALPDFLHPGVSCNPSKAD
jgi:hypothetical protein